MDKKLVDQVVNALAKQQLYDLVNRIERACEWTDDLVMDVYCALYGPAHETRIVLRVFRAYFKDMYDSGFSESVKLTEFCDNAPRMLDTLTTDEMDVWISKCHDLMHELQDMKHRFFAPLCRR
jgi:hypothetical protein